MARGLTFDSPLEDALDMETVRHLKAALDVTTVEGLLRHYPRRYDEPGHLADLSRAVPGDRLTCVAKVTEAERVPVRGRARQFRLLLTVEGAGGTTLRVVLFNQWAAVKELRPGVWAAFAGTVGTFQRSPELGGPAYDVLAPADVELLVGRGSLAAPTYRVRGKGNSLVVLRAVGRVLTALDPAAVRRLDAIPPETRLRFRIGSVMEAYDGIHLPRDRRAAAVARRRLAWEEAFVLQVELARRRRAAASWPAVPRPGRADGLLAAFDAALPYELTAGQRDLGAILATELAGDTPMLRLLQGEVGSGKTVVALRAMLATVDSGGQAVLLAPTEVLAQQHARTIRALLGDLGRAGELGAPAVATRVALLTGSVTGAARREALLAAASGEAGLVVGTHALLRDQVQFADLGLVVVDEQHRFGVEQRDALRWKADQPPHVLVMTATPIPRTVAMTVFGDLAVSELRELPVGRSPVATTVVPAADRPAWLDRVWERLREEVAAGRQAYVVCPRILADDPPEDDGYGPDDERGDGPDSADEPEPQDGPAAARRPMAAALAWYETLRAGPLAGLRVGLLHGRLDPEAKEAAMAAFTAGEVDVLVATTVVEVGLDVPNATAMVVLDAERFGASQLHQLRGRVGRGTAPGLCLFVTWAGDGSPSRERLDQVAASADGFEVAAIDLRQRREGNILGPLQAGRSRSLRLLSLERDGELIAHAREAASVLVAEDPDLGRHPRLAAAVARLVGDEAGAFLEKA